MLKKLDTQSVLSIREKQTQNTITNRILIQIEMKRIIIQIRQIESEWWRKAQNMVRIKLEV